VRRACSPGVRWICRWKAFWAHNRAVLAHRERMGPRCFKGWFASASRVGSATENASGMSVRLVRRRTSAYGSLTAQKRGEPPFQLRLVEGPAKAGGWKVS
jgi:hypothetical protein